MRAAPNPRAFTRVVWGLTSRPPGSPGGLSSGFPFARRSSSPSPAFGWLPFVRRSPVGFPSPGDLHVSAAAGRCRRRWSRPARTKVTSSASAPRLGRPRSAHAAGGQRPGTRDAAAGSPGTSGRERMTSSRPAAIAKCDTQRWPAEFVIADYLRLARCHLDALMSRQSFRFCALGPPRAQTAQSESGVWG